MGQRITQQIYECSRCGTVPENGEHLWEMCGEIWCKACVEKEEEDAEEEEDFLEPHRCATCGEVDGTTNPCCPGYDPLSFLNCGYD